MSETAVTSNLGWDNFFSTTTTGALTATTTTIPLATPPTPTEGFLVLDPGGANEIIFYNSVSGNNVIVPTTDDRGRGDSTAQAHSSGITVKMNTVGQMFEALQSGLGLSASFAIPAGVVKPEDLTSGTGTSWVWQSWSPTLSGRFNDAKWTKACTYIQIGKTVHYKFKVTASTTTPMDGSGEPIFTLPVTSISYSTSFVSGMGMLEDLVTAAYSCQITHSSTTTARVQILNSGSTYVAPASISSTVPMTWTTGDFIEVHGTYEAA